MRDSGLDEMQMQKRNMVGNQSFLLIYYLLLIDIGFSGFGFRWLNYPMNVFVIMNGCMAHYLIRIIWNRSYVGPRMKTKTVGIKIGFVMGLSALIAGVISFLQKYSVKIPVITSDNGATLLFIFSTVLVIVIMVVGLISKWQTKKDDE